MAQAKAAVIAAYRQSWVVYQRALLATDANDPELPQVFGGELLDGTKAALTYARQQQYRFTGTVTLLKPTVTVIDLQVVPATATFTDCVDDTGSKAYMGDALVISAEKPSPTENTAQLIDGAWRMTKKLAGPAGSGVCAA